MNRGSTSKSRSKDAKIAANLKRIAALVESERISAAAKLAKQTKLGLDVGDRLIGEAFIRGAGKAVSKSLTPDVHQSVTQALSWVRGAEQRFHEESSNVQPFNSDHMAVGQGLTRAILRLIEPMDHEGQYRAQICEMLRVDPKDYT